MRWRVLRSSGVDVGVVTTAMQQRMNRCSGVATGWTGVDMSTPLLLEVAPEIDTNPTSFYRGGVPPPPDPRYWLALRASHVCPPHIFRPGDAPEPIEMLFGGRLAWTYGTMH